MKLTDKVLEFFGLREPQEEYEAENEDEKEEISIPRFERQHSSSKFMPTASSPSFQTSFKQNGNKNGGQNLIHLVEPRGFNDVQDIADHLLHNYSVIVNIHFLDASIAKRILDFLSGTIYGINGTLQKTGADTYLCVPHDVALRGSIADS